jgi:hypothetical protein
MLLTEINVDNLYRLERSDLWDRHFSLSQTFRSLQHIPVDRNIQSLVEIDRPHFTLRSHQIGFSGKMMRLPPLCFTNE